MWNRLEKVDHLAYISIGVYCKVLESSNDKKFGPVLVKLQALSTEDLYGTTRHVRDIYQVQIDILIYQIYQYVGGFSAKFVSSRISQNIFFHTIGNKSFHFIF